LIVTGEKPMDEAPLIAGCRERRSPPAARFRGVVLALGLAAVSLLPAETRGGEAGFASVAQDPGGLDHLLAACAVYCGKLSAAVLDFICEERIEEEIYDYNRGGGIGFFSSSLQRNTERNRYLYDYQMVRWEGTVRESRTLLQENRRKTNEARAPLKTKRFYSYRSVYGPVGFFGRDRQPLFDYELGSRAKVGDVWTRVIDIKPKDGRVNLPSGKAWVSEDGGRIVKLEMDAASLEGYEKVMNTYDLNRVTPRFKTEHLYEVEKNGLLFPSRTVFRESLRTPGGRRIQVSRTEISYVNYRFFTVQTQETIRKEP